MPSSSVEPLIGLGRGSSKGPIPWLLSTIVHCLLLLALTVQWGHRSWSVPNPRGGVEVTILPGQQGVGGTDEGGYDETVGAGPNGGGLTHERLPEVSEVTDVGAAPIEPGQDEGQDAGQPRQPNPLSSDRPTASVPSMLPVSGRPAIARRSDAGGAASDGSTARARGSGGLQRGYARTGVFGIVAEGRKFVYVFDRSGSMDAHGGAPLHAAKAELIASLQNLAETHQFQIIFYNERPRVFSPTGAPGRLVFGTEQNKYLAQKFVGSITADGATRHEEALALALRMDPDVIFFLTDADEPRMTGQQLEHIVRINHGTSINAIEFGYGAHGEVDNFLVKLAEQNGGQHAYIDVSRLPRRR